MDDQGRALAHTDSQQVGVDLEADPCVATALEQREGSAIVVTEDGERMLTSFAPVGGTGWVVLVQEPVDGLISDICTFYDKSC